MNAKFKQRLTGAIVLIALSVIFLPMLFESNQAHNQYVNVKIPEAPEVQSEVKFDSATEIANKIEASNPSSVSLQDTAINKQPADVNNKVVLAAEALAKAKAKIAKQQQDEPVVAANKAKATEKNIEQSEQPKVSPQKALQKLARQQQAGTETIQKKTIVKKQQDQSFTTKKVNVTPKLAITKQAWTIQIGAFANDQNAIKLSNQLKQQGYRSYVLHRHNNNKTLSLVYVGPYSDKNLAMSRQQKLSQELHIKGLVTKYKPTA